MTHTAWHYTTRLHLQKILESRHIRITPLHPEPGETPGAWFTLNRLWEPTAAKQLAILDRVTGKVWPTGKLLTFDELERAMGLARIGIPDIGLYHWAGYATVAQDRYCRQLQDAALAMAQEIEWPWEPDLSEWRVSLAPVSAQHFTHIEIWKDGDWRTVLHE